MSMTCPHCGAPAKPEDWEPEMRGMQVGPCPACGIWSVTEVKRGRQTLRQLTDDEADELAEQICDEFGFEIAPKPN